MRGCHGPAERVIDSRTGRRRGIQTAGPTPKPKAEAKMVPAWPWLPLCRGSSRGIPSLCSQVTPSAEAIVNRAGLGESVGLHQFRKTFVAMIANKRGLEQARIWAGHEDTETRPKYLAEDPRPFY